jgi:hypothetical protein
MTTTRDGWEVHATPDQRARFGDDALRHSWRWRQVSTGYPRAVALAYGGDVVAAMADTDEAVAARVAEWERAQGLEPHDWLAIGGEERNGDDDDPLAGER